MRNRSGASGNILFLILLAVVLFAALSYAVTESLKSGNKNASAETLSLEISKMENMAVSMRIAIQRMITIGGYQPWQIDYSGGNITSSHSIQNTTCTSNACRLHHVEGGNVTTYKIPPELRQSGAACEFGNNGSHAYIGDGYRFRNTSIKGVGIDNQVDLTLMFATASDALCGAINKKYSVANGGIAIDTLGGNTFDYYGTYTAEGVRSSPSAETKSTTQAVRHGDNEATITGKQMFCTRVSNGCNYVYIVLYER